MEASVKARTDWGKSLLIECAKAVDRAERLVEEAEEERARAVGLYESAVDDRVAQRSRIAELEANANTRWHEMFGSPERVARMIADACTYHGSFDCSYGCLADEAHCGCGDYDALLEWLKQEVDA